MLGKAAPRTVFSLTTSPENPISPTAKPFLIPPSLAQVTLPQLSRLSTEQLCTLMYASSLIGSFSSLQRGSSSSAAWLQRLQAQLSVLAPSASPQVLANVM